jgi:hypothetical protein
VSGIATGPLFQVPVLVGARAGMVQAMAGAWAARMWAGSITNVCASTIAA